MARLQLGSVHRVIRECPPDDLYTDVPAWRQRGRGADIRVPEPAEIVGTDAGRSRAGGWTRGPKPYTEGPSVRSPVLATVTGPLIDAAISDSSRRLRVLAASDPWARGD